MDSDLEYIYEHYIESSDDSIDDNDYMDKTWMMHAILEDAERAEEYVLNFKGFTKGHQVLNCNRAHDHLTLMDDYFAPLALFADHFRRVYGCARQSLIVCTMASGPMMTTSS